MTVNCVPCDQSFDSGKLLRQYKQSSNAHVYDCTTCDRHFGSGTALRQHRQDSRSHPSSFECDDCDRLFDSNHALQQHLRDSHPTSIDCELCNRSFGRDEDLQQHLRNSPAHSSTSNEERSAHGASSSFNCQTCERSFGSEEALEQHLRNSRLHQENSETPLDAFFLSFRTCEYDPSLPPATSFSNLRTHEGWRRSDAASDVAWNKYQDALRGELRMWYGEEEDLSAWHALCRAIGVKPLPKSCEQCKEV
jgi:hypothetical protein